VLLIPTFDLLVVIFSCQPRPRLCAEFTVVGHSSTVSTCHQNWPRQTWFPLLSSCCLELTS